MRKNWHSGRPIGLPTLAVISTQENTVKNKILNLKTNKAIGPDEIAPRLIELLGETVVSSLISLFTSSLKAGAFPLDWKTAKLTTVHKNDEETDRGNYCPLSILGVPCKINDLHRTSPLCRGYAPVISWVYPSLISRKLSIV